MHLEKTTWEFQLNHISSNKSAHSGLISLGRLWNKEETDACWHLFYRTGIVLNLTACLQVTTISTFVFTVAIPWDSSASWHLCPQSQPFFEELQYWLHHKCSWDWYPNACIFKHQNIFFKKNIKTFVPANIVGYVLKGRLMKLSPQMWYPTCWQSLEVHPTDMQWIMSIVPCVMGFNKIRLSMVTLLIVTLESSELNLVYCS